MPEPKKFAIELSPSVSILVAGAMIAAAIVFVNLHPAPAAADPAAAAAGATAALGKVPPPSLSDHIIGSPSAPIVLVEYSDFQCPYCDMIYPSLKDIVDNSGGKIAWVMRNFPLYQIHPEAMPAAEAAECIADQMGNSAWWQFATDDFANQSQLGSAFFSAEAQKLGANMTQYNACVASNKFSSKIQQETADAEAAGGNGTPFTVVINTKTGKQYQIPGALPEAQIKAIIATAQSGQ